MKASISWLNEYVDLSGLTPAEVAEKLTMAGLEVEALHDGNAYLNEVVTAKLIKVQPHPNSDHLKCCEVEAGPYGRLHIVCGAPNAREGLISALAPVGVTLPNGLTIKASEIRGQRSEGMLCSEAELAVGPDASGIIEISGHVAGKPLKAIYPKENWLLEIGITPNRPDGLSIVGLARDLAAVLNRPLTYPDYSVEETGPEASSLAKIEIEAPEHAYRYAARVIIGVKIGPSPAWLVEKLESVGIRSINNVVDVTNLVMMEIGQPMHAFDLNNLAGRKIVVKLVKSGEKFTTLDGQERELKATNNLLICDGEKPVGLAGIMGGLNSEITDATTDLLLEAAAFNPTTIRRTARAVGLSTDASFRYERGCDVELCAKAANRAASLIAQLTGGKVAKGLIDVYPRPFKPVVVPFSPKKCNALLGTSHKPEDMIRVLTAIGFSLTGQGDNYNAVLPPWRPDLHREVDVVEEVARLLEFDALPSTLPAPPKICQSPPPLWQLRQKARVYFSARGLTEIISYSFLNPDFSDKLNLSAKSAQRARQVRLLNPLTEDHRALRPTLAPCLLNALRRNQYQRIWQVAIFEVGAIFLAKSNIQPGSAVDEQPDERQTIAGLWAGQVGSGQWSSPEHPVDFWDVKGLLEGFAAELRLEFKFSREDSLPPYYDPAEAAVITLADGRQAGHVGRLNKAAFKAYGLKDAGGPVYLYELDSETILNNLPKDRLVFQPLARYPEVNRDLALVLDKNITAGEVCRAINGEPKWPIVDLIIFDVYEGHQLPEGKKSLALRLTFQDREKTLTDELVGQYFNEITAKLANLFGAQLRS